MRKSANEICKKIHKSDPEINIASLVSYSSRRQHPLSAHGVSPRLGRKSYGGLRGLSAFGSVLIFKLRHGAPGPTPAVRPDSGPLPDYFGQLGRHQQGARPWPADSVLHVQGAQAGLPALAAGHPDPAQHGFFRVGRRPGSGLRQRGAGPGPPGSQHLSRRLHEDAGRAPGGRSGVLLPALDRRRRGGWGHAPAASEPALRCRKPVWQTCNKGVSSQPVPKFPFKITHPIVLKSGFIHIIKKGKINGLILSFHGSAVASPGGKLGTCLRYKTYGR